MANTHSHPRIKNLLSERKSTWKLRIMVAHLLLPPVMSVWAPALMLVSQNLSLMHLVYCLFYVN